MLASLQLVATDEQRDSVAHSRLGGIERQVHELVLWELQEVGGDQVQLHFVGSACDPDGE